MRGQTCGPEHAKYKEYKVYKNNDSVGKVIRKLSIPPILTK